MAYLPEFIDVQVTKIAQGASKISASSVGLIICYILIIVWDFPSNLH